MKRDELEEWCTNQGGQYFDEKTSYGCQFNDETLRVQASTITIETTQLQGESTLEFPRSHYNVELRRSGYTVTSRSTGAHWERDRR